MAISSESRGKIGNEKIDIDKALKLPHLVKSGNFNFRKSVTGNYRIGDPL